VSRRRSKEGGGGSQFGSFMHGLMILFPPSFYPPHHHHHHRYGVHLVVANILTTRYREVLLVTSTSQEKVVREEGKRELEASFVPAVAEAHYGFIADSGSPYGMIPSSSGGRSSSSSGGGGSSKGDKWWKKVERDQVIRHLVMGVVVAPAVMVLVSLIMKRVEKMRTARS